ncbi:hypothetical protein QAO71_10655 [Halopseudomonas sp. SMJS2]|uniref:hypothetical protein n=1 Tax=Halopseudomonas sp. SMJS2 TaxID=3041098 RepID=UPI002452E1C5|nr:hypothetical protein [Halopseudomonas sp. SMJS2]WGK60553.1 hypothetical protein QAO71_10655 [Halopseudomonas sp. SMJS2]
MLLQQTIDPAPAAQLAAQVEQYLNSGGQIEVLPGPTITPLPSRIEPSTRAEPRKKRLSAFEQRYVDAGPQLIDLFSRGLSITLISEKSGFGRTFIYSALRYHGIEPTLPQTNEVVVQLQQLAAKGYTMRYAAQCVGKTLPQAQGLARRNGIKFRAA